MRKMEEEEKRREGGREGGFPRGLFIFKLISNYRRYEGTRALPAAPVRTYEGRKRGKVRDQDSSLCSHVLSQFAVLPSVPLSRFGPVASPRLLPSLLVVALPSLLSC